MAKATLTSSCNMNHPAERLACKENSSDLRDVSIHSNLNNSFKLKLTGNPSPIIATPDEYLYQMSLRRKKTKDGESSVFTAEKYFNEGINVKTRIADKGGRKQQCRKEDKVDQHKVRQKTKPRNPSLSSEASSNSHNTLSSEASKDSSPYKQSDKPRNQSLCSPVSKDWSLSRLNEQRKVNAKRLFNSFSCKCTCTDEKSIDIKENVGENKNSSNNCSKNVDNGDVDGKEINKATNETDEHPVTSDQNEQTQPESSPKEEISSQKVGNSDVGLQVEECFNLQVLNSEVGNVTVGTLFVEEKARKSLEVFGSPILDKVVPLRVMEIPKFSASGGMFYDIESDSSSDLFEIKNFSDNFSTQWDHDEPKIAENIENPKNVIPESTTTTTTKTSTPKTSIGKTIQRRRDSMLLSCRSHKAVKIVGTTYKIAEKAKSDPQRHPRSEPITPMSEYQINRAKVRDFKTGRVRHSLTRKSFS